MIKVVKSLSIWIFGVLMFGLFANVNVHAADTSSIMKKWVFTGYAACARGVINTPLDAASKEPFDLVADDVFPDNAGLVELPSYGFGNRSNNDAQINCKNLFLGEGALSGSGILNYAGVANDIKWGDYEQTKSFLTEKVGYGYNSGELYFRIHAIKQVCTTRFGRTACSDTDIYSPKIIKKNDGTYGSDTGQFNGIGITFDNNNNRMKVSINLPNNAVWDLLPNGQSTEHEFYVEYDSNIAYFAKKTEDALRSRTVPYSYSDYTATGTSTAKHEVKISFLDGVISDGSNNVYKFNRNDVAMVNNSIKQLSGLDNLNLTDSERFNLYTYYLKEAVSEVSGVINCESDGALSDNEFMVKLKSGAEFKDCRVGLNGVPPQSISVYDLNKQGQTDLPFPIIDLVSLAKVINWLNNVDTSKLEDVDSIENQDPISEDTSSLKELCEKEDLNGQGWILCPALENMTYTASGMDSVIQWLLGIDTGLYDFDSAAYKVWQIMRGFANILMIIFLLFIIFSQITGFGIDNYGIKKMLPRLIVAAILINLSFVICMVAVDLSNILGVGLRDMFGVIGKSLEAEQGVSGQGFIDWAVKTLFVAGTAGVYAAPTAASVVAIGIASPLSIVMVVVVILLALLGAIAAIVLFIASLSARMILVILCISVAPIAFALYVLPNTQNIFKRWLSVFKAVLVVFPICGALGGISELIKGIARDSSDWVMLVIGLLAPFMVFFLLPSLLRNALSAIGQIGAAFQTLSQKMSGGIQSARGAIEKSGLYRDAMEQAKANKAKIVRDALTKDLNEKGLGRNPLMRAINESRLRTANRRATIYEVSQERMYEDALKYQSEEDRAKALESALREGNTERAIAAIKQMDSNGQTGRLMGVLEKSSGSMTKLPKNDLNRQRLASALQQTSSDLTVGYGIYLSTKDEDVKDFTGYLTDNQEGYGKRLLDKGEQTMSGLSKDDQKLLNKPTDKNSTGTGAFDALLDINAGANPNMRAKTSEMLGGAVTQSRLKDDHREQYNTIIRENKVKAREMNLNPEQLIGLRKDTVMALQDSYEGNADEQKQKLLEDLSSPIRQMMRDPRIRNRMDKDVLEYFEGIMSQTGGSEAQNGGGRPNNNQQATSSGILIADGTPGGRELPSTGKNINLG